MDATPRQAMDGLFAADRAFAEASAATTLVPGLSAMFATDVAMPLPGGRFSATAAEAADFLRTLPGNGTSRADWTPVGGGISADGQQGYTWGPMRVHAADGTVTPMKYLSYWVRQPDGWRVAAYRRRPRADAAFSPASAAPVLPARSVPPLDAAAPVESYRASLDRAERAFSADAQVVGLGIAFQQYGRPDAVHLGGTDNPGVVVGAPSIGLFVSAGKPAETSSVIWAPDRTIVATSGDLGVTIGLIREKSAPAGATPQIYPFFTVWQRANPQEPWRYVAE